MTKTLQLTAQTEERAPPAGRAFAAFRFTLRASSGAEAPIVTTETVVQFPGVEPGQSYLARVQAEDAQGGVFGEPVQIEITIPTAPGPATYPAPTGLSWRVL